MDTAKSRADGTGEVADGGDGEIILSGEGTTVPAAVVTPAVRSICKNDTLCERFSNVNNSLAGTSFQAVQELLDRMDAPAGREGVW